MIHVEDDENNDDDDDIDYNKKKRIWKKRIVMNSGYLTFFFSNKIMLTEYDGSARRQVKHKQGDKLLNASERIPPAQVLVAPMHRM